MPFKDFPFGSIFFIALGVLLIVFHKRFARETLAWHAKYDFWKVNYTEFTRRFTEAMFLVVGIGFIIIEILKLLMPSL